MSSNEEICGSDIKKSLITLNALRNKFQLNEELVKEIDERIEKSNEWLKRYELNERLTQMMNKLNKNQNFLKFFNKFGSIERHLILKTNSKVRKICNKYKKLNQIKEKVKKR